MDAHDKDSAGLRGFPGIPVNVTSRVTAPAWAPAWAPAHRDLALAVVAVAIVAVLVSGWAGLAGAFVLKAVTAALLCAVLVRVLPGTRARVREFTVADRITLGRGALIMLLVAMVGELPDAGVNVLAVGIATIAALLDALDGQVARRAGHATAFGARFDMETDALLVLVLSVLAWTWDRAGPWILLAGLARYLFVACAAIAPFMKRELPASRRRQTVCVVQVVTLIVCAAPWVPSPLGATLAAAGLCALVVSFTTDVLWLWRRARPHPQTGEHPS